MAIIAASEINLKKFENVASVVFYGYKNIQDSLIWDDEEGEYYYLDENNERVYVEYYGEYYYYSDETGKRVYNYESDQWHYFTDKTNVHYIDDIEEFIAQHPKSGTTEAISTDTFNVTFFSETDPTGVVYDGLNWDYQSLYWEATTGGYTAYAIISVAIFKNAKWSFNYPKTWKIIDLYNFRQEEFDYEDCGELYYYNHLMTISFNKADSLSSAVSTEQMFKNCMKLKNVDFSNSVFTVLNNADKMFFNCFLITDQSILLNSQNTFSNLISAEYMFDSEMEYDLDSGNVPCCGDSFASKIFNLINNGTFETSIEDVYLRFVRNGIKYRITGNTDICVDSNRNCAITSVTIPSTVTLSEHTLNVLKINEYAFKNNNNLLSIVLAGSITDIEYNAFYNCKNLTSIVWNLTTPTAIVTVGNYSFYGCNNITSLITNATNADFSNSNLKLRNNAVVYGVLTKNTVTVVRDGYNYYSGNIEIPSSITNGNTFTVTEISQEAFQYSDITSVIIPNTVTKINNYSFYYCSDLTSVLLPQTITEIGREAFYNCQNIDVLIVPDSVTSIGTNAFYKVTAIIYNGSYGTSTDKWGALNRYSVVEDGFCYDDVSKTTLVAYIGNSSSITIPNTVTEIKNNVFANNSNITSVDLGGNVTTIGTNVFYGCDNIVTVQVSNTLNLSDTALYFTKSGIRYKVLSESTAQLVSAQTTLSGTIDATTVTSGNTFTVNSVAGGAFKNCTLVTSVVLPSGMSAIADETFYNCTSLQTVNLYSGLDFGEYAFYNCTNLAISVSIRYFGNVGKYAFYNCSSLTTITFDDCYYTFGEYAFYGCLGITNVSLSANSINDSVFENCTNLTTVTLGYGIKSIGNNAFKGCTSLNSLTFYTAEIRISRKNSSYRYIHTYDKYYDCNRLSSIGESAFENCSSLTTLDIPYSYTSIEQNNDTFFDFQVSSMGDNAFKGCTSLTSVLIFNFTNNIGTDIFANCPNISVLSYQTKNLQTYFAALQSLATSLTELSIGTNIDDTGRMTTDTDYRYTYVFYVTNCYNGYSNLDKVTINKSTYNLSSAFNNTQITDLTVEHGWTLYYFNNLEDLKPSLKKLKLGDSFPSSGFDINSAFTDFDELETVIIGDSVASIPQYAFYGLPNLKTVVLGSSVSSIGTYAFYYNGSPTIQSLTIRSNASFSYLNTYRNIFTSTLKTLELSGNATEIPNYMFQNCSQLTNVTIANTVENIGYAAFLNCSRISYNKIGNDQYLGNTSNPYLVLIGLNSESGTVHSNCKIIYSYILPSVGNNFRANIPKSVKSITLQNNGFGNGYFTQSKFLGAVVDSNNTVFSSDANGVLYNKNKTKLLSYPKATTDSTFTIPSTVTEIYESAFYDVNMASLTIPSTVTTIGDYAFGLLNVTTFTYDTNATFGLIYVTTVNVGDSVTSIKLSQFSQSRLTTVNFGSNPSLTSILNNAFGSCTNLTSIRIPNTVTSIDANAFRLCDNLTTIYYSGSATGAPWGATNATILPNT